MKNILYLFSVLLILVISSCKKESNSKQDIDISRYTNLSKVLTYDLNSIGNKVRESKGNFLDPKSVLNVAEKYYCAESEEFDSFQQSFNLAKSNSVKSDELTALQAKGVYEITVALATSSSALDFTKFLNTKFDEVLNSNLEIQDKDFLLMYITSYVAGIEFINNNLDIISPKVFQSKGWWDSWGKCAAGIVGGVIGGGLVGGAAGSVIPILGTTGGLIVGGIGGGLAGAAEYC